MRMILFLFLTPFLVFANGSQISIQDNIDIDIKVRSENGKQVIYISAPGGNANIGSGSAVDCSKPENASNPSCNSPFKKFLDFCKDDKNSNGAACAQLSILKPNNGSSGDQALTSFCSKEANKAKPVCSQYSKFSASTPSNPATVSDDEWITKFNEFLAKNTKGKGITRTCRFIYAQKDAISKEAAFNVLKHAKNIGVVSEDSTSTCKLGKFIGGEVSVADFDNDESYIDADPKDSDMNFSLSNFGSEEEEFMVYDLKAMTSNKANIQFIPTGTTIPAGKSLTFDGSAVTRKIFDLFSNTDKDSSLFKKINTSDGPKTMEDLLFGSVIKHDDKDRSVWQGILNVGKGGGLFGAKSDEDTTLAGDMRRDHFNPKVDVDGFIRIDGGRYIRTQDLLKSGFKVDDKGKINILKSLSLFVAKKAVAARSSSDGEKEYEEVEKIICDAKCAIPQNVFDLMFKMSNVSKLSTNDVDGNFKVLYCTLKIFSNACSSDALVKKMQSLEVQEVARRKALGIEYNVYLEPKTIALDSPVTKDIILDNDKGSASTLNRTPASLKLASNTKSGLSKVFDCENTEGVLFKDGRPIKALDIHVSQLSVDKSKGDTVLQATLKGEDAAAFLKKGEFYWLCQNNNANCKDVIASDTLSLEGVPNQKFAYKVFFRFDPNAKGDFVKPANVNIHLECKGDECHKEDEKFEIEITEESSDWEDREVKVKAVLVGEGAEAAQKLGSFKWTCDEDAPKSCKSKTGDKVTYGDLKDGKGFYVDIVFETDKKHIKVEPNKHFVEIVCEAEGDEEYDEKCKGDSDRSPASETNPLVDIPADYPGPPPRFKPTILPPRRGMTITPATP